MLSFCFLFYFCFCVLSLFFRSIFVLCSIFVFLRFFLFCERFNEYDEVMHGKTYRDCHNEIKDYGKHEGENEHDDIERRFSFADRNEVTPFAHIVCYYEEDSRNNGHRDPCGIRHKHN